MDSPNLTRDDRNWGYQLGRGPIEVTPRDFGMIAAQMASDIVVA